MPKLDAIGITVSDISRARAFYGLLDITIPDEEGEDHVESVLPNGLRLMFDTVELMKQIDASWQAPTGHRMGLAFACDSPAEVDATHAKIVAAGFASSMAPWDAFWGQRYAQVVDADGNKVDLFAPL